MNSEKKIKLLGVILGVALFAILIAGVTYAYFTWRSENVNISGTTKCFTLNYTAGPSINNENVLLFDQSKIISGNTITVKNGMALTGLTAGVDSGCTAPGIITISVTPATDGLNTAYTSAGQSTGAFKYVVAEYDPSTYNTISVAALAEQKFTIISKGSITSTSETILLEENLSNTTKGYLIIFYVDGYLAQNDAQDSTFSATIKGVATQTEY